MRELWDRLREGADREGTRYVRSRRVFLASLGAVYVMAFASMVVQVRGLCGAHGIIPAQAKFVFAWLGTSNAALIGVCIAGMVAGGVLVSGFVPRVAAALAWLLYLSVTAAGGVFMHYQWDALLCEAGLLAILVAPWSPRQPPSMVALWLVRWLLFRLMFLSGVVKLMSQDPSWRDGSALTYHYWTQPIPARTSWWADAYIPPRGSTYLMFFIELVVPFFIFAPRRIRHIAAGLLMFLQIMILATGNYGFFNVLTIVLCIPLLDDDVFARIWKRAPPPLSSIWMPGRIVMGVCAGVLFLASTLVTLARLRSTRVEFLDFVQPLRSLNTYGLFAHMTKERPEIIVEASLDGVEWKAYEFRYKPGRLDRAPPWLGPHMPRLDWQMWFAALAGHCSRAPWFVLFQKRLLENEPSVTALLADNPFATGPPPQFIRSTVWQYRFAEPAEHAQGVWWRRERVAPYCPMLQLMGDRLQAVQ